nr:MAG TPA: hypothetical protein [Caudoviricetes sp.]
MWHLLYGYNYKPMSQICNNKSRIFAIFILTLAYKRFMLSSSSRRNATERRIIYG